MRRALVLGALMAATPVAAQEAPSAEGAQEAFDEGVQALRVEHFEEAAAAFQRAYELEARAETACNLALTYDRWTGHKEEAIDAYLQCAQDDETGRFRDHALARASTLRSQRSPTAAEELPPVEGTEESTEDGDTDLGDGEETTTTIPIVEHGQPPPRSHTLLFVGGATAVVGLGLIVGGAVPAAKGRERVERLEVAYPGRVITDAAGADLLQNAEDYRRRALALYISGGIVAAAGLALAAIDLARGSDDTTVTVSPTWGGAMASLELQLR